MSTMSELVYEHRTANLIAWYREITRLNSDENLTQSGLKKENAIRICIEERLGVK